eukprot:GFYU01002375.1.p1 GENE.GFYU01002375.1~~GFYU01002375.1.p1  ORF type:complete len:488 (+),score=93.90 GFYU01002375.1:348-1811(+)
MTDVVIDSPEAQPNDPKYSPMLRSPTLRRKFLGDSHEDLFAAQAAKGVQLGQGVSLSAPSTPVKQKAAMRRKELGVRLPSQEQYDSGFLADAINRGLAQVEAQKSKAPAGPSAMQTQASKPRKAPALGTRRGFSVADAMREPAPADDDDSDEENAGAAPPQKVTPRTQRKPPLSPATQRGAGMGGSGVSLKSTHAGAVSSPLPNKFQGVTLGSSSAVDAPLGVGNSQPVQPPKIARGGSGSGLTLGGVTLTAVPVQPGAPASTEGPTRAPPPGSVVAGRGMRRAGSGGTNDFKAGLDSMDNKKASWSPYCSPRFARRNLSVSSSAPSKPSPLTTLSLNMKKAAIRTAEDDAEARMQLVRKMEAGDNSGSEDSGSEEGVNPDEEFLANDASQELFFSNVEGFDDPSGTEVTTKFALSGYRGGGSSTSLFAGLSGSARDLFAKMEQTTAKGSSSSLRKMQRESAEDLDVDTPIREGEDENSSPATATKS